MSAGILARVNNYQEIIEYENNDNKIITYQVNLSERKKLKVSDNKGTSHILGITLIFEKLDIW